MRFLHPAAWMGTWVGRLGSSDVICNQVTILQQIDYNLRKLRDGGRVNELYAILSFDTTPYTMFAAP